MANGVLAIVVLVVSLFGFFIFILIRGKSGYKIRVKADIRNPSRKPYNRLAFFDKNDKVVKFYKSILHPTASKTQSYFDPDAFSRNRIIDGYVGVSGKEDDDNFVPIGDTLVSGAMANSYSQKLCDKIVAELQKITTISKETNDAIVKTFDKAFVMNTFGIVEVKDVNLILQHQKIQVADLHSRTNEFKLKHLSWFNRNQVLVGFLMMCFVVTICGVIFWQETAKLVTTQATTTPPWVDQLISGLTHNATKVPLPGNGNVTVK
jgi:hypothetical protein